MAHSTELDQTVLRSSLILDYIVCTGPDKRGIEDNSKIIFSYFPVKTYVVIPHQNRLGETVLWRDHTYVLNK